MNTKELIEGAVDHLRSSASVKTVYGDPITAEGKTVIPIAKVAYGFGGGSGEKRVEGNGKAPAEGGGVGGGVVARPVGVVEITNGETKIVRFGETKKLAITTLVGSALGLVLGFLAGRRSTN
jgi:uncharacterized spore protein YtfJ